MEVPQTKSSGIISQYWHWIVNELSQMAKPMVMLFGLGTGFQLSLWLSGAHTFDATVTFFATVISLLCVTSMSSGFAINGLVGAISVFLLVAVALKNHLYATAIDQIIFLLLIDIPLMRRWRTWSDDLRVKARVLNGDGWLVIAIFATIAFVIFQKITILVVQSWRAVFTLFVTHTVSRVIKRLLTLRWQSLFGSLSCTHYSFTWRTQVLCGTRLCCQLGRLRHTLISVSIRTRMTCGCCQISST